MLQRQVEKRLRAAGARPADARVFFGLAMAGPSMVTHGSDEGEGASSLRPMFTGEDGVVPTVRRGGAGSRP